MLKNYLRTALRNIFRHKGHSVINILGLAIGIACFAVIFSYVEYQFRFDHYNKKLDRIYRMTTQFHSRRSGTPDFDYAWVQGRMASLLSTGYPQITRTCRLVPVWDCYVERGGRRLIDKGIVIADSTIFNVFTFHFIRGDERTALVDPHTVVLTRTASLKYFGTENSVGKVLKLDEEGKILPYTVSGVMEDVPRNSHFSFDMLIPFEVNAKTILGGEDSVNCYTYLLLKNHSSAASLRRELPALAHRYNPDEPPGRFRIVLQPVKDIHLHSHLHWEWEPNIDIRNIYILSLIAVLVLLVAGANFTNITIAQHLGRVKEVGVRKTMGAARSTLVLRFLTESVTNALVATAIGLTFAEILLSSFKNLSGEGAFHNFMTPDVLLPVFLIGIASGIASGLYPSLYLSSFSALNVMRRTTVSGKTKPGVRKSLVVFEFVISIGLIVCTIVVEKQFNFMENKDLGFDKNAVVLLHAPFLGNHYETFDNALLEKPGIVSAGASFYQPGQGQGSTLVLDPRSGRSYRMYFNSIDGEFLKTLKIKVVQGRSFSNDIPTTRSGFLLNQEAAEALGWRSPVGRELVAGLDTGMVTGVVKDVFFSSLRQKIAPTVYFYKPSMFYTLLIRVSPRDYPAEIKEIHSVWNKIMPDVPFEFQFLDQNLDKLYRFEERLGLLFEIFGGLAIVVGCLGLFGLVSFSAERRTKEIGIRKVLGASVPQVVLMLMRDYAGLILLANVIAWPLAYYAMHEWLENFAYRVNMDLWMFVSAAVVVFVIAMVTVSFRAVRAASASPVRSLRYE